MTCDEARPHVSAAFDGELDPARGDALAAHLAGCSGCRAFSTQLTVLRRRLRFQVVGDVPDVTAAVLAALGNRTAASGVAAGAAASLRARSSRPVRATPGAGRRRAPAPPLRPPPTAPRRGRAGHALRSRRGLAPVTAAFLAGLVAAVTFVGPATRRPDEVRAADLPQAVVAAQARLSSLAASVEIVERGWHPEVPERRFRGRLRYRSPESLSLVLRDETAYPVGPWVPSHVIAVVADASAWTRAGAGCPREAQPGCNPPAPRVEAVRRREPFADAVPSPLDLVLPVDSFTLAAAPPGLGRRTVAGRPAVGLVTTVAQLRPLLDGLLQGGGWRELYPSDPVELWLDAGALVPLALTVRPDPGHDRGWWAARAGYDDPAGAAILHVVLRSVRINEPLPEGSFPPVPAGVTPRDAGFRDAVRTGSDAGPGSARPGSTGGAGGAATAPSAAPEAASPGWLPAGMRLHRTGMLGDGPDVAVSTWTDGRAWVKVRAAHRWPGGRLFGELGQVVRRVRLSGGETAYVAEGGSRVALHAADVDVEVSGSIGEPSLRRVAASLDVTGRPVPAGWLEASATTLREARRAAGALLLPAGLDGFAAPSVRIAGGAVALTYLGPGARAFVLTQAPGSSLTPPLERDVRGVLVRGTAGRYTPSLGELEWVEDGRVLSLRSHTLSLAELVAIARRLRPR